MIKFILNIRCGDIVIRYQKTYIIRHVSASMHIILSTCANVAQIDKNLHSLTKKSVFEPLFASCVSF